MESNWGGVSFKSLQNMLCCNIGGTLCAKKSKNAKQKNERMSKVCRYQRVNDKPQIKVNNTPQGGAIQNTPQGGTIQNTPHWRNNPKYATLSEQSKIHHTVGTIQNTPHCRNNPKYATLSEQSKIRHTVGTNQNTPHCQNNPKYTTLSEQSKIKYQKS